MTLQGKSCCLVGKIGQFETGQGRFRSAVFSVTGQAINLGHDLRKRSMQAVRPGKFVLDTLMTDQTALAHGLFAKRRRVAAGTISLCIVMGTDPRSQLFPGRCTQCTRIEHDPPLENVQTTQNEQSDRRSDQAIRG